MTVKEFKAALEKYDDDLLVVLYDDERGRYDPMRLDGKISLKMSIKYKHYEHSDDPDAVDCLLLS